MGWDCMLPYFKGNEPISNFLFLQRMELFSSLHLIQLVSKVLKYWIVKKTIYRSFYLNKINVDF